MDALELLLNRVSVTRLVDPAPTAAQLDVLLRAALRAPDHGQLRPWRFLTVQGEARTRLGELFADALRLREPDATEEALRQPRKMPLRAPMVLIVIARVLPHPKIPASEQVLAVACGLNLPIKPLSEDAMFRRPVHHRLQARRHQALRCVLFCGF